MISKNRRLKVSKGMMLASRVIYPDNSDHIERDKTFWPDGWLLRLDFRCSFVSGLRKERGLIAAGYRLYL